MNERALVQKNTRYREARNLLEQRSILPVNGDYTTRQLAEELSRRGWHWTFDPERAEETKAYPPSPSTEQTIVAEGPNSIASLTMVLASAIRFDEEHGLSSIRPFRADIIARTPNGSTAAVIEVKNREELSSEIATTLRRNLLVHGLRSLHAPYFMLLSQEVGYLWDQRDAFKLYTPPTLGFSLRPVIERYAPWLEPGERLGEAQLELIVAGWLKDLVETDTESHAPLEDVLEETGFLNHVRGTMIVSDTQV